MRFLVFALILSFLFSGYTAAAHAFGPVSGDQGQVQMTGAMLCADCQNDNSGNTQDQDGGASGTCINCHHCCAGHIAFLPLSDTGYLKFPNILVSPYSENAASAHIFSLLRPPRNLV